MRSLRLLPRRIGQQLAAIRQNRLTRAIHSVQLMFRRRRGKPQRNARPVRLRLTNRLVVNIEEDVYTLAAAQQFSAAIRLGLQRAPWRVDRQHVRLSHPCNHRRLHEHIA